MKRPWDVRYHYCMCWLAGLMPVDGIYFCILLSSQNSEVSIYIVPNTCRWCEASMGCQLSVPHVWSRWFDARGLHIFLYTNFKSKLWSVHDVKMMWSVHGMSDISTACVESLVRCPWLAYIFMSKLWSVHIYSPKYV